MRAGCSMLHAVILFINLKRANGIYFLNKESFHQSDTIMMCIYPRSGCIHDIRGNIFRLMNAIVCWADSKLGLSYRGSDWDWNLADFSEKEHVNLLSCQHREKIWINRKCFFFQKTSCCSIFYMNKQSRGTYKQWFSYWT